MALIHDVENLMRALNANCDAQSTVKTYEKIQDCISQNSDQLSENVKDDLISLIKLHLKDGSADVKKSALATWVLLLRTFRSITDDFVKVIYSDVKDICVKECTLTLYSFLIKEGCLESLAILLKQVEPNKREELLQSIFLASADVPTETFYKFILNNVVNSIFLSDDNDVRQELVKFALFTKDKYPLSSLPREKQKEIGGLFKASYIPVIDGLRQQNNSVFYELSIFVMNYCGKLLHSEIELTNSILRNIEAGFKTRTIDDRLMAYECWKVLIDNCNLDHDYLCSNKQLKLLVKPLKIKLSKHESVVCKRFEVWSHFIEALQQKALIYMADYLDYCFGPLSPNKFDDLVPLSNEVLKTWPKRTDILMRLIGHYGHEGRTCIKSVNFKFDKSIITASNFVNFDYHVINSVGVCCERLLQWEEKNARNVKVKCMWGSLFNIFKNLHDKHKENVLKKTFAQIKHLLKKSLTQADYFDDIIKPMFEVFTSFKKPVTDITLLNQFVIFPVVEVLLPHQSETSPPRITSIVALVRYGTSVNDKLTYFENACALIKGGHHKKKECLLSLEVWLQFADVLFAICKTPRDSFAEFERNARFFMTWMVKHLFPGDPKDKIIEMWRGILLELTAISSSFKEGVLQDCEAVLKESPDLILNVVEFLQIFVQLLADDKGNKAYIALLLSVTSECLKNPCTPKARVLSLVSVVKRIVEVVSLLETNDDVVLDKLCNCVINILQPHQVFEILPVLKVYFSKINEEVKQKLHSSLHKVIGDLVTNANFLVAKDAAFLLSMLEKPCSKQVKSTFPQPPVLSTRSARIANMATGGSPTSPANVLRLFGQKIESPVRVRGTQLNKATPSPRSLKIANAMPKFAKSDKTVEDDDKDFVLIDTEVKIDKSKMSEHQKEVMRKRRDDIPALYQDLTQSQNSNSLEPSQNTASLLENKTGKGDENKIPEEKVEEVQNNKKASPAEPCNEKPDLDLEKQPDPDTTCLTSQDLKDIEEDLDAQAKLDELQKADSNHFDASKEVELDFEALDFDESQEISKEQDANQVQENDIIITSFAENNVCLDEKFLGADLFVGFNQSVEVENNDELNNLMSSKQISDYEKQEDVAEKAKDFDQSVKCPDLSIFDFVSSEIDEIEQSSDIDNLLHDLHKSPVKRHRRSLSYDSSQADEIELAQKNLPRVKRGSAFLKKRKIQNMHSRFKRTLKENERQKSVEIAEGEAAKSKENIKNPCLYEDPLINECQILKQLDDEILKIDRNLKENSDVVGNTFNDVLLMEEGFGDIGKPLDDFSGIEGAPEKSANLPPAESTELQTVLVVQLVENTDSSKSDLQDESVHIKTPTEIIEISDSNDYTENLGDKPKLPEPEEPKRQFEQFSEDLFETQIIANDSPTKVINQNVEADEFQITKAVDEVAVSNNLQKSEAHKEEERESSAVTENKSTVEENEESEEKSAVVKDEGIETTDAEAKTDACGERVDSFDLTEEDSKEMDSLLTICAVQSVEEDENSMATSTYYRTTKADDSEIEDSQKSNNSKVIAKRVNPKRNSKKPLNIITFRQRRTRLLDKIEKSVGQEDEEESDVLSSLMRLQGAMDPLKLEETLECKEADRADEFKEGKKERVRRQKIEKPTVKSLTEKKGKETKKKGPESSMKLDEEIQQTINKFLDSMTVPDVFSSNEKPENESKRKRTMKKQNSGVQIKTELTRDFDKDVLRLKHENKLTGSSTVPEENIYVRRRVRTRSIRQAVLIKENRNDNLYLTESDEGEGGRKKNSRRKPQVESPEENPRKRRRLSLIKQENSDDAKPPSPESQDVIESSQATCESVLKKSAPRTASKFEVPKDDVFKKESEQLNFEIKEAVNSITKNRSPQLTLGEPPRDEISDGLAAAFDESKFEDDPEAQPENESQSESQGSKAKSKPETKYDDSLPTLELNFNSDPSKATESCDPSANLDVDNLIVRNEASPDSSGHINLDSLPTGFGSPPREVLPGSPVCEDTPVRNSELFSNTVDISPIRTHKEDDNDVTSCSIADESPPPPPSTTTPLKKEESVKQPSSRSARLLNLVPGSSSLKLPNPAVESVKRINPIRVSSPATERIRKMLMNCGEETKPPSFDDESDSEIVADEILAFSKEVPSPLAIPGSSILKRKACDVIEDGTSPCPKRKRVNFSDPPTTSQKIFFKEEDESRPNFKKAFKKLPLFKPCDGEPDEESGDTSFSLISGLNLMKAEPIYPLLTSCNDDVEEVTSILGKDDLIEQFRSVNVTTVGDLAKLNGAQVNQLEFLESPKLMKVMDALETFYSLYADDDEIKQNSDAASKEEDPVFPDLADCEDSIHNILKMFSVHKTAHQLRRRNIHSVGQLAKMKRYEIKALHVREPKVSNVVHALTVYNHKLMKEQKKKVEATILNFAATSKEVGVITEQSHKIDAETQTDVDEQEQASASNEPSEEAPKDLENPLGNLSRNDLLGFIKRRFSSEEIKELCGQLTKEDA